MSDEIGSLIKEANPPSTLGKIEGSVLELKSKNWVNKQEQCEQKNSIQKR